MNVPASGELYKIMLIKNIYIMEGIAIKRNPNEGKLLENPIRKEVVQAVVDAFLKGGHFISSKVYVNKDCVDLEKKEFANYKKGTYPSEEEMQTAFDVLNENGYYIFVEEYHYPKGCVEFTYIVSEFKNYKREGYKPTTKYIKSYYRY